MMPADAEPRRVVTVLGGTGFLGRRVVEALLRQGFAVRVAARHPERTDVARRSVDLIRADVDDDASVAAAVAGSYGVVNAVSLYREQRGRTFRSVHVVAAERVARLARQAGVDRFAHLSGIGADPGARSPYIRSRGEGEEAVRRAFPDALVIRPSVMVGPDDALLAPLRKLLRRLPVFPLFGRGEMRLQPVHVEDVAEAIARSMASPDCAGVYELAGLGVYTYAGLLRAIAARENRRPLLVPVPFALWRAAAMVAERLPTPPITRTQIDLMESDNTRSPTMPGFETLGLSPRPITVELQPTSDVPSADGD